MQTDNWKQYINMLLTSEGAFQLVKNEQKGQTYIEYYLCSNNNFPVKFTVGYLGKTLIYLNLSSKIAQGYSKQNEGEYFFDSDFDEKRQSKTGLQFDKINQDGIRELLENGLEGKEVQYYLDNNLVHSTLHLLDEHFKIEIDFTNRNLFQRLFSTKPKNEKEVKTKTVNLKEVFPGVKNVL